MDRLTFRTSGGMAESCEPINCFDRYSIDALVAFLEKLADYEEAVEQGRFVVYLLVIAKTQ